ncbi:hypothetical protein, partial [Raoultella terrigena]|uniref:hypothetical protein n=1 Tax=Raoultella terrigena TaxID=577 RepID=UPI001C707F6F
VLAVPQGGIEAARDRRAPDDERRRRGVRDRRPRGDPGGADAEVQRRSCDAPARGGGRPGRETPNARGDGADGRVLQVRDQRREPLDLVPVAEDEQERVLRDREVDMALVRLPVERDGLHVVRLYDEVAVVVAGR